MEFWKAVFGLARHKFIGPPILALAVVAGVAGFLVMPAHYTANVVLLLTGPGNTQPAPGEPLSAGGRTNPLLQDSAGLRTTAAALILSTGTPEVLAELGAPKEGPNKLTIDDGSTNQALFGSGGPFLSITADSPGEQTAHDLVVRAQQRVEAELAAKQRELGAPSILYISLVNVTPPSTPEEQLGDKVQTAGIAVVLTVFLGFSLAYAWTRRQARLRAAAGPEEDAWSEAVDTVDAAEPAPISEAEVEPVLDAEPAAPPPASAFDRGPTAEVQAEPEDDEAAAAAGTQAFHQVEKREDPDEDAADTQTFPKVEIP
ncbi:hypothetical protein ACFLIM_20640 [Nonomuraea sp. M3C6]|uniref:Capsular polysaccharide biosynthesis protein n=1 Tax=Nonomuraea marmarensis TaxID=3351344 RepID=A0ABW7AE32_9ACTN